MLFLEERLESRIQKNPLEWNKKGTNANEVKLTNILKMHFTKEFMNSRLGVERQQPSVSV